MVGGWRVGGGPVAGGRTDCCCCQGDTFGLYSDTHLIQNKVYIIVLSNIQTHFNSYEYCEIFLFSNSVV